jgi:hypothetical protein
MKMLILVTLLVSTLGIDLHEPEELGRIGFVSASPIIRIASDTTVTLAGGTTNNSARRTDEGYNCDLEMCCNQDGPCRCMLIYKQLAAIGVPNKR